LPYRLYNHCHMEIPLASTAVERYGARPGFEPDIGELHPSILDEIPLDQRTVFRQFEVGRHADGSPRLITAFGGDHTYDPSSLLLHQTKDMCSTVIKSVPELDNLTAFYEGRIRDPDLTLTDEVILALHGELGLSEAEFRRAGVSDHRSPEPYNEVLLAIAKSIGFEAVNDYLAARMLPQWGLMSDAHRPSLVNYLIHTLHERYPEIVLDYRNNQGQGAIIGFQRRLTEFGFPLLGEMVPSNELSSFMREQTTLLPALRVPRFKRTPIQHVAVAFNMYRVASFINQALDTATAGRDVVIVCSHVHVRSMTPAFEHFAHQMSANS